MSTAFLEISNGVAFPRERIPHLAFDQFRREALDIVSNGGKVVHFFAYQEGDALKLMAILRNDRLLAAGCDAPDTYAALSGQCEPFHMFEREIA